MMSSFNPEAFPNTPMGQSVKHTVLQSTLAAYAAQRDQGIITQEQFEALRAQLLRDAGVNPEPRD